jgi:hypothetical protein
MNNKLPFEDFLKKVKFMVGDKVKIQDLNLREIDLYHLKEFLNLEEEKFIEEMYKILLRRVYDEPGKIAKLNELKEGKSRKDIIRDMINSEEGRNYIGKYEILGMDYNFDFLDENILYKYEYSEEEFNKLIEFLNFRFNKLPNNIIDLLNYSGSEFVFLLYKIILKREPDFLGFKYNLFGSYLFKDKFQKIKDFLLSDEAKEKNVVFYDLKGRNILDVSIEDLFQIDDNLLLKDLEIKEFTFNLLINNNLLDSILLVSFICKLPKYCFELIAKKIFFEKKTIIETIFEEEILSSINDNYVLIDFFNKEIKKNSYSIIDDLIRNNSYYISSKQIKMKEDLYNFNFIKNLTFNLDNEIYKLVKFLKNVSMKEDLYNLYSNDRFLEENINILGDILREHEEFILSSLSKNHKSSLSKNYKRKKR